jgi:tetratricopeptide (TPR) repeat protein
MKQLSALVYLLLSALPALAADATQEIQACDQALQSGAYAEAAQHAELALRAAPDSRHAYLCLGRAQGEAGKHAEAVAALQAAGKLATQPTEHIVALTLLGNQHLSVRAYPEAAEIYRQSLAIARSAGIVRFQNINLNQLGETLEGSGDVAGALEHYQQGMKLAANENERADSNARIAAAYSLLGEHDKAIEHQFKAMLQEERSGDLDHYANANIELGRISLVAGQYADAEKWLGRFLVAIAQSKVPYWEAKGRYLLGKVKAAQGKGSEAAEQFALSKVLAEQAGDAQLLKDISSSEAAEKPM